MFKLIISMIGTFLVLTSFVYYSFENKFQQQYNHYIEQTAPPIFQSRAMLVVHENPINRIQNAILQNEYKKSIALCNMFLAEEAPIEETDKIYLLLSYSLLQQKQILQAQDYLFEAYNNNQDKEAIGAITWLLALTYLYTNDIEKCKEYLSLTLSKGSLYAHLAQDLQQNL